VRYVGRRRSWTKRTMYWIDDGTHSFFLDSRDCRGFRVTIANLQLAVNHRGWLTVHPRRWSTSPRR
jgi:hypothetical protein